MNNNENTDYVSTDINIDHTPSVALYSLLVIGGAPLVTDGIFRFSRNPMYVALTLLYSGIGAWVNSLWIVLCLAPVLVVMHQGVIRREERYLEDKFGDEYLGYKFEVGR